MSTGTIAVLHFCWSIGGHDRVVAKLGNHHNENHRSNNNNNPNNNYPLQKSSLGSNMVGALSQLLKPIKPCKPQNSQTHNICLFQVVPSDPHTVFTKHAKTLKPCLAEPDPNNSP
jgi:hypothetical protein